MAHCGLWIRVDFLGGFPLLRAVPQSGRYRNSGGGVEEIRTRTMITRQNRNQSVAGGESEVLRLAIEVHGAARQTRLVTQAVTRVAAEVRCLADEVDALAAEYGQEPAQETPRSARSAPGGGLSR